MHRSWIVSLILGSALRGAAAQQPATAPGSRIRVTHHCQLADAGAARCDLLRSGSRWRHTGTLVGVQSDTLLLRLPARQADVRLPLMAIRRVEVPIGKKSAWGTGAKIGLLAGAVVGAAVGNAVGSNSDPGFAALHAIAGIILGAPAGLIAGGITGAFLKTDRWVTQPITAIGPMGPQGTATAYGISLRVRF